MKQLYYCIRGNHNEGTLGKQKEWRKKADVIRNELLVKMVFYDSFTIANVSIFSVYLKVT